MVCLGEIPPERPVVIDLTLDDDKEELLTVLDSFRRLLMDPNFPDTLRSRLAMNRFARAIQSLVERIGAKALTSRGLALRL